MFTWFANSTLWPIEMQNISRRSDVVLEKEDHWPYVQDEQTDINKEILWCLSPINCLFTKLALQNLLEKIAAFKRRQVLLICASPSEYPIL